MSEYLEIPDVVIEKFKDNASTRLEATSFNQRITLYSAYDEDTLSGYETEEDFVRLINTTSTTTEFDVSLKPTTKLPNATIPAKYISNQTMVKPDIYDAASLIFTQKRPVYYSNVELTKNNQLLFATINQSIYTDDNTVNNLVSKDVEIFVIDTLDPQYDENGKFQYTKITLKKVQQYVARKGKTLEGDNNSQDISTSQYIVINFYKTNIQPRNWKRRRITFKDKPIFWELQMFDEDGLAIDWKLAYNVITIGNDCIQPYVPKLEGNGATFYPIWSNEVLWMTENFNKFSVYTTNLIYTKGNANVDNRENCEIYTDGGSGDTAKAEWAVNTDYKYAEFQTSLFSGGGASKRNDLIQFGNWILSSDNSLSPSFNCMNYNVAINNTSQTNSSSLIRREQQADAPWTTWKYESTFTYDLVSNVLDLAVYDASELYIARPIKTINAGHKTIPLVPLNPELELNKTTYRAKRRTLIENLLKKKATLMGEDMSSRPPDVIPASFDISGNPQKWNKEELKSWTGWIPTNFDAKGVINEFVETQPQVGAINTPTIKYQLGRAGFTFANANNIKTRTITKNFYQETTNGFILEIESETPFNITQFDMRYFGGYEYTIEDFQNTYADMGEEYNDIPCVDDEGNPLVFTYQAENRRGNPRALLTSKIYSGTSTAKKILIDANRKKVAKGEKELYNVNTGEKIK